MTISRGQMERQLRMGGGIMDIVPREPAIFGGIKRAVKKATKSVKKIAKSDLGKAALIGAAAFGIPGTSIGGIFGRSSFMLPAGGRAPGIFGFGGIGNALAAGKAKFFPSSLVDADDVVLASQKALGKAAGEGIKLGTAGKFAALAGVSTFLTKSLGMSPEQAEEELARDPSKYLELYYRNLNPRTADTNSEEYEAQVRDFVTTNTSEYAVGGRVGYADGTYKDFEEFMMRRQQDMSERQKEELRKQFENYMRSKDPTVEAAVGGKIEDKKEKEGIMMAGYGYNEAMADTYDSYLDMKKKGLIPPTMDFDEFLQEVVPEMSKKKGIERTTAAEGGMMNLGGNEMDLRGGGFVPIGAKEKADDVPARLSKNEFVFTADAVRAAGGGSVDRGADLMYKTMKQLENKVV